MAIMPKTRTQLDPKLSLPDQIVYLESQVQDLHQKVEECASMHITVGILAYFAGCATMVAVWAMISLAP